MTPAPRRAHAALWTMLGLLALARVSAAVFLSVAWPSAEAAIPATPASSSSASTRGLRLASTVTSRTSSA